MVPRCRLLAGSSGRIGIRALLPFLALVAGTVQGAPAPRLLFLDGAVAGRDLVAVGERGAIWRSGDDGANWTPAAAPTRAMLTGVAFAPEGRRGWAVGHDAIILGTADGGRTWRREFQAENLQDSFLDVLAVDERQALAVGAYGLFCETRDGGATWTRRKLGEDDYHLNRISRGPTGTLYLAGEHGTLLRSADAGRTWQPMPSGYTGSFYGVLPLDRRTLLAYGLQGRIHRSADDGATWERITPPVTALLAGAVQLRSNFVVAGGSARTLLVSRDYGRRFEPIPDSPATAVAELVATPTGRILALGEAGITLVEAPK